MLPHLVKEDPLKSRKSKTLAINTRSKKSNIWLDQYPPSSNTQIYTSCTTKLSEAKANLEQLDQFYKINDMNLFDTMTRYARHLSRLRVIIGISEIKSYRSISDLIKIINNNIKNFDTVDKEQKLQKEHTSLSRIASTKSLELAQEVKSTDNLQAINKLEQSKEDISDTESEIKSNKKENIPSLNFSSTLNYVVRKKPHTIPILKRDDSIISPILIATKRNFIRVDKQTEEDLSVLVDVVEKTLTAMSEKYSVIIKDIENICSICEKYMLSFYEQSLKDLFKLNGLNDSYEQDERMNDNLKKYESLLDTVIKYDEKRNFFINFVYKSMRNLNNVSKNFNDGTINGVYLKQFSEETQKLSKRFDLDYLQVLLIIPEYSKVLNKCVSYLKDWIEYDKEYPGFILNDLKSIDKKNKSLASQKYNCEKLYNQLMYRIELVKNNLYDLSMNKKRDFRIFDEDGEESFRDYIYTERKEYKPRHHRYKYSEHDCRSMLQQINAELSQLEPEVSILNRKFSEEKFDNLKKTLTYLREQLVYLYQVKKIEQNDVDILKNCHFKLKEILMYKSCTETLEKIYFNISLPSLKFGLPNSLNNLEASNFEFNEQTNSNFFQLNSKTSPKSG